MKANSGKEKRKGNSHNLRYWTRLQQQFMTCAYDHTGAYSELRERKKSPEMTTLQQHLELAEQIMRTERYKNLRKRMAFAHNTERLSAVLTHKAMA